MSQTKELSDRVTAKRKEIEGKLYKARADSRKESREAADGLEKKLKELNEMVKDGFDNVSEAVAKKLNDWLGKD